MKDLVTIGTAARILGVSADWVRKLDSRKVLKSIRTDCGIRLFNKAEVEALAAKRAINQEKTA